MNRDIPLNADDSDAIPRVASRKIPIPTSWRLWFVLLVLGLAGIAVAISIPAYRRLQALRYFDSIKAKYEFSPNDAWMTERLGEWANGLRRVDSISMRTVSDEALRCISVFQEVKVLQLPRGTSPDFEGTNVTLSRSAAQSIRNLPNLESVSLGGQCYTDEFIAELLGSQPLQGVSLRNCGASRLTLTKLTEITTITSLHLSRCEIDDDDFIGLDPLPHLQRFSLSIDSLDDDCLNWLAGCTELEQLKIWGATITLETMQRIGRLHNVTRLEFAKCEGVNAGTLVHLIGMPHLERLDLHYDVVNSDAFAVLEQMPSLEEVWINQGSFRFGDLEALKTRPTTFEIKSFSDFIEWR